MSISSNMSINLRQNGANGRKKNSGHLEPSTVNHDVAGSSPARGATKFVLSGTKPENP